MCRAFRLAWDDSLPLNLFIAQVRRWYASDLLFAGVYCFYAYEYKVANAVSLLALAIALVIFYAIDGITLEYVTSPGRVFVLSKTTLQLNTAVNCVTFAINMAYSIVSISHDSSNQLSIALACFFTFYKGCKCYVLHKFSVRVLEEGPVLPAIHSPLLT